MKNDVSPQPSRTGAAVKRGLRRRLPFVALLAALVAGVGLTQRHVMADEAHMVPPPTVEPARMPIE